MVASTHHLFRALPEGVAGTWPEGTATAHDCSPFHVPPGWRAVAVTDDDFDEIRSMVIAAFAWSTERLVVATTAAAATHEASALAREEVAEARAEAAAAERAGDGAAAAAATAVAEAVEAAARGFVSLPVWSASHKGEVAVGLPQAPPQDASGQVRSLGHGCTL